MVEDSDEDGGDEDEDAAEDGDEEGPGHVFRVGVDVVLRRHLFSQLSGLALLDAVHTGPDQTHHTCKHTHTPIRHTTPVNIHTLRSDPKHL